MEWYKKVRPRTRDAHQTPADPTVPHQVSRDWWSVGTDSALAAHPTSTECVLGSNSPLLKKPTE